MSEVDELARLFGALSEILAETRAEVLSTRIIAEAAFRQAVADAPDPGARFDELAELVRGAHAGVIGSGPTHERVRLLAEAKTEAFLADMAKALGR